MTTEAGFLKSLQNPGLSRSFSSTSVWSASRVCWHGQHAWIAGYHWIPGSRYGQQGNDWKWQSLNIPELIYCQRQRKNYKVQPGKKLCGPEAQMLVFNNSWKNPETSEAGIRKKSLSWGKMMNKMCVCISSHSCSRKGISMLTGCRKRASRMEEWKVCFRRLELSFFNLAEGKLRRVFLSVNSSNKYD